MTRMKNISKSMFTLLLLVTLFTAFTFADEVNYSDSWGKHGFELKNQKANGVEIDYSIESFSISNNLINNMSMQVIELPGNLLQNDEGAPNLPGTGRYVAIPQGATVSMTITASRTDVYTDIDLAPAPRIPWETEKGPLEYSKNMEIFSKDAFYPEQPVLLSEVTQVRGVDVVMLGITPFQYNPVTKELIVYRDLKVKLDFIGGNGYFGEDRLRSRWWDPLLADMLLNYESLPKMDYNKSQQGAKDIGCEYLIVSPNGEEFQQWADSIKQFRTLQGIMTDIVTLDDIGGNTVVILENYFNNAFNTWDIVPSAVLLLGDYGSNANNSIISPIWDSYCASDNIFADVNNNDMPDMVFARMTAQNATHLETMVTKFMNYERTPPTSEYFYQNPITALGFQTERWFQICSEAVAGFWEVVHGKTTNRINALYSGTPGSIWSTATNTSTVVSIFGPDGLGYIPAQPSEVDCSWYGTANDVIVGINAGAFMLQHRDHGSEQGWGEPGFQSNHINSLTNTDLTFVWSINCLTGKYNMSSECFTEKFHRYTYNGENAGALGLNAASEVSYSFVNDTYVWGAFDNIYPEFLPEYGSTPEERGILPAFGSAAGKYFLEQSSWPYNSESKEVTYNLFHHHGDAFMTVFSEVPQELTVNHNPIVYAGVTSFDVTANAGAYIALTVNGEIIGTAEATGGPVSISIPAQQPPDMVIITITKQNYYRYEATLEVIPPSGPYVVQHEIEINDEAGNGNGIMETSESILASLTLKNVGIDDAENVMATISSEDEYITITDDSESYGTISAGATVMTENGFAWEVANNIPDNHMVIIEVNATDGNETWTTSLSVIGHAPELEVGTLTIDDSEGNNNGRIDPGETVDIIIETYNTGSYIAINTMGYLTSSSGYLTLNNESYDLNVIGPDLMEEAIFSVTASTNTPIGTNVNLIYGVVSGGYNAEESFVKSIGLIVEDWETGDMGQFDWVTGGNASWALSQEDPFEGIYSIKSGDINDQQDSWFEVEYEVFTDDIVSFYLKVSSESGYDFLKFYIDNNIQGSWAGEVDWISAEFPIVAGMHTIKWVYDKDGSVSNGSDCAWVDFIILPAEPMTTAYAGLDANICEGNDFVCAGDASLYNILNWESSGTGTFESGQELNAIYTPSADDIAAGYVELSLTAYGPENTVTDQMTLTINPGAIAHAGDDVTICSNTLYELNNASAENYNSVIWTTTGDGTFDDNFIINPVYTPGTADIEAGSVSLTFMVISDASCPEATDDILLTIEQAATVFAGIDTEICSNMGNEMSDAVAENYTSIEWTTAGDGSFNDNTLINPEYTPGVEDATNGEVTLFLTAMGNGLCEEVTSEIMLTVLAGPMAFAGEDNFINYDQTYIVEDAIAENYNSVSWSTSGDGSFDDENSMNPIYTPGANDIEGVDVVLTMTASNIDCGEVSDDMILTISPLGVYENLAGFDVAIFPNPNTGVFSVELNGASDEKVSIRIYNSIGSIVYESENIKINQTYSETLNLDVDQGVYYLRIEGTDLILNKKIIIQK